MTFTTRTQVQEYLESQGKPANFVRALINEYLNHESSANDQRDLIWRDPDLDVQTTQGCDYFSDYIPMAADQESGMVPVQVTRAWCLDFYENQAGMLELTDQGITFDGDLCFDLNGNYLPV